MTLSRASLAPRPSVRLRPATAAGARRFYRQLGFEVVGRRMLGADHWLVRRLERAMWEGRIQT